MLDDTLLNIYSFKFNEVYIFWHEIKKSKLMMDDPMLSIYNFKLN